MVNLDLGLDLENTGNFANTAPGVLLGAITAGGILIAALSQSQALGGQVSANGAMAGVVTQTNALVVTISAAAGLSGDFASSAAPDAMFSGLTVQANGWELDGTVVGVRDGGTYSGLNDSAAPGLVLGVSSKSWTSLGVETTITRNIFALTVTRQPYANHALLEETEVGADVNTTWALSQRIYSTDTITKATLLAGFFTDNGAGGALDANLGGENPVTNSSTLAYYNPQAVWLSPNLERITSTSYKPRLFAMHWHARNGQPVRAVTFTATDESLNSISQTVSTLTTGQFASSGKYANWYEPDLDLSALTDGELVTIDATIYPWVGDSYTISVSGETYPNANLTVLKVLNDAGGTYGTVYASVDGVGAGTPAVSTAAATADTTPYASIGLAAIAIQTYNNANNGRNNVDGGVVRLLANTTVQGIATNFGDSLGGRTYGKGELLIEGLNRATSIITDTGSSSGGRYLNSPLRFKNLTMEKLAGNFIFLHSGNLAERQLVLDQITFLNTGGGVYGAWLYRIGREYFFDCDGDDCGQGSEWGGLDIQGVATSVGCEWPMAAYNCIACGDGARKTIAGPATKLGVPKGQVFSFNFYTSNSAGNPAFKFNSVDVGPRGLCFVGNVSEGYGGTTQPALQISADSDVTPNINMIEAMNTR